MGLCDRMATLASPRTVSGLRCSLDFARNDLSSMLRRLQSRKEIVEQ